MGICIFYSSIYSPAHNWSWQYQPVNASAVVSWYKWKDLDPLLAHVLLGRVSIKVYIIYTPLFCHFGSLYPNEGIEFSMGFPKPKWSLPLQSLESVWSSCTILSLGQTVAVDNMALWMISKENNCLTPFELLKRPEIQLKFVLIARKEACSSPLEVLENLVDYLLGRIDQCQAQQEHVTSLLYCC